MASMKIIVIPRGFTIMAHMTISWKHEFFTCFSIAANMTTIFCHVMAHNHSQQACLHSHYFVSHHAWTDTSSPACILSLKELFSVPTFDLWHMYSHCQKKLLDTMATLYWQASRKLSLKGTVSSTDTKQGHWIHTWLLHSLDTVSVLVLLAGANYGAGSLIRYTDPIYHSQLENCQSQGGPLQ